MIDKNKRNKYRISMDLAFDIIDNKFNKFSLVAKGKYGFILEGVQYEEETEFSIYQNVPMIEIKQALDEGKIDGVLQNKGYSLLREKINEKGFAREHLLNRLRNKKISYTYEADEINETMTILEERGQIKWLYIAQDVAKS